jgi:hypothetical protein
MKTEALAQAVDCLFDGDREIIQPCGNALAAKGLVRPKHNLHNYINGFPVARPRVDDGSSWLNAPCCYAIVFFEVGEGYLLENEIGRSGRLNLLTDIQIVEGNQRPDCQNELVLVGDVELMKRVEHIVPARIRLERAEFLDSFFTGKMYLSMRERSLKCVRLSTEGELNVSGAGRPMRTDDIPCQMVEGRSKIVDSVSDDKREIFWDGLIYVNAQGAHAGATIILDKKFGLGFPIEILSPGYVISDVMLGPL